MDSPIQALITQNNFPASLIELLENLDEAYLIEKLSLSELFTHKNHEGKYDLITAKVTDLDSGKVAYIFINDKDKNVSFGKEKSIFDTRLNYNEIEPKLFTVASAFAAKEYIEAHEQENTIKHGKYKSTRFITPKKYEGMTHDTLLEALSDNMEVMLKMEQKDLGLRIEPINIMDELLLEYSPTSRTMMVDGCYAAGMKTLIRVKIIEMRTVNLLFN